MDWMGYEESFGSEHLEGWSYPQLSWERQWAELMLEGFGPEVQLRIDF